MNDSVGPVTVTSSVAEFGWQGLALEKEYVIFNSMPSGTIVRVIPASEIAPITVNEASQLVPGTRVP